MSKNEMPKPTDAELEILNIIWQHGPSTVRFINEKLSEHKSVGYTTTLKMLQIMTEKKLVQRDERKRSHIYKAAFKENETQKVLLDILLETAFGGSATKLVMQALGNHKTSKEEINQIKDLLNKLERNKK